jgi:hypothetical protein
VDLRGKLDLAGLIGTDVRVSGPAEGFEADIELPRRVDLVAALTGGALHLRGIDGSKNITAKSGEIEIEIGDRNQYRRVVAAVRSGALSLPGFRDSLPGQRSLEWIGSGSHDLSVQLDAGTITLRD